MSDIDTENRKTNTTKRRRTEEAVFDGELPQIMQNAEVAIRQARYAQRDSWRRVAARSSLQPIGVSDVLLDKWSNENILFEAKKPSEVSGNKRQNWNRLGPSTGNPLSVVKLGDENVLICPISGSLDSVGLFDLRISMDSDGVPKSQVFRKGLPVPSSNSVFHEAAPVTDIVATDWECGDAEPSRLLVTTRTSLNFAKICTSHDRPVVDWVDHCSFPPVLSCAINPLYSTEFAAISTDGLYFGSPQDYVSRRDSGEQCFHDVQVLARQRVYNRVFFGSHPRSLLLSSRLEVAKIDMRGRIDKDSMNVLFDVRRDWNLPWHDSGIAVFNPLHPRSHTMFVATQACINFFDLRMPQNPLLDWSMSLPLPVEQASTATLTAYGTQSEVIALASRKQSYLEVYHAIHDENRRIPPSLPCTLEMLGGQEKGYRQPAAMARRPMLWSDLPLSHLKQVKDIENPFGMALVPLKDDGYVSLVQWSVKDGLIGQLLEVKVKFEQDGKACFEDRGDEEESHLGSSVAMCDFQRRLLACGEYRDRPWMQRPVHKSMPGSLLHQRTKRLYLSDVRELRLCVLRMDDDDTDGCGFVRLPRPFLADIPVVLEIRHLSGTTNADAILSGTASKDKVTSGSEDMTVRIWDANTGESNGRLAEGMGQKRGASSTPSTDAEGNGSDLAEFQPKGGLLPQAFKDPHSFGPKVQASLFFTDIEKQAVGVAGRGPERSEGDSLEDGAEDDGDMSSLLEQIGSGKTLDEIGRLVRGGIAHNATPLGAQELQSTVESAPMVRSYEVEWHSLCMEDHMNCSTAVSTNGTIPDWVHTRVYYTEDAEAGKALEISNIDVESGYGRLLMKMRALFAGGNDDG